MAQEEQLQQILTLVQSNGLGLTTIIERLANLPPVDNPAIQDEIDGILTAAREQQAAIDAVLNPPTEE